MTSDYPTFSVRVPRGFKPRFASVYRPSPGVMGGPDKHGCCFPVDELPEGAEEWLGTYVQHRGFVSIARERDGVRYAMARSNLPPVVIPGIGSRSCFDWWQHQLAQCDAMNLPRDFLLREMPLVLLVQPFEWRSPVPSFRSSGITLNLKAVNVVHPSDDQDIKNLLAETRAAITEGSTR